MSSCSAESEPQQEATVRFEARVNQRKVREGQHFSGVER